MEVVPRATHRPATSPRAVVVAALTAYLHVYGAGPSAAEPSDAPRDLAQEYQAADLRALRIEGNQGAMRITVGTRRQISVRALLQSKKDSLTCDRADVQAALQEARIEDRRRRDELRIALAETACSGDIEATWSVILPSDLSVAAKLGVGPVDISGVAGGVTLDLGVGHAEVVVPSGMLRVEVGVGKARIRSESADIGNIDLRSHVGSADLTIGDHRFSSAHSAPGEGFAIEGEGEYDIVVSVRVGTATLQIAGLPQGLR